MSASAILDELGVGVFRPLWPFRGGWAQTIAALYWPQRGVFRPDRLHTVTLNDGDRISVLENRPLTAPRLSVVLVHGLTGSCDSTYMSRLARKFLAEDAVVFRMNLRGCGPGFGLAKQPYHSGRSEDAREVVRSVSNLYPELPVLLIGFSLGANIVLKMAGEDGDTPTGRLAAVAAVSPPSDLAKSAAHLAQEKNRLFDQFFVRELRRDIAKLHAHFPELPLFHLPEKLSLMEFDDAYTAPRGGFKSAKDYYEKSSSLPLIPRIRVPCLILSSMDDPVVDSRCFEALREARDSAGRDLPGRDLPDGSPDDFPDNVKIILTERGGHVGFLGRGARGKGLRWMDQVLLAWGRILP